MAGNQPLRAVPYLDEKLIFFGSPRLPVSRILPPLTFESCLARTGHGQTIA